MDQKIKQRGFIQIPLLIAIIVSVISVAGVGYGGIEYKKISNSIGEAKQLAKEEKYNEANEKLESTKKRWIVKTLGIQKEKIAIEIENNKKLSEDKLEYSQGVEEFNKENWEKTKELLSKVSEISPYYQDAKRIVEEIQRRVVEEAERKIEEERVKRDALEDQLRLERRITQREIAKLQLERQEAGEGQEASKCLNIPELPDGASKLATKIIDGDTFLIEGGYSVRILGIDADERGHLCYDAAKTGLEELILNQEVRLEKGKEDFDRWCRYLRYVLLGSQNISLELVKKGLAIARFSPEDVKYREEIAGVEKEAKDNKVGCKWGEVKIVEEKKAEFRWERLTTEKLRFDVVGACLAGKHLGRELIVDGKVVDAYRHLKSNTVFLNFEKAYPNQCFTGVIFSSDLYRFVQNPEDYYLNKTVRIFGEIKEYKGRPQIILETPLQIEVGE